MVADPSKLIDADTMLKQVHSMEIVGRTFTIETTINSLCNWINSQPDASEPLRDELARKDARIKELESKVAELADKLNKAYDLIDGGGS